MLFVTVEVNPARTIHQNQNTLIFFLFPNTFHQSIETQNTKTHKPSPWKHNTSAWKSILISEKCRRQPSKISSPTVQSNRRRRRKRTRFTVANRDSTPEAEISTNQNAKSRRRVVGAVEKRRNVFSYCVDRKWSRARAVALVRSWKQREWVL